MASARRHRHTLPCPEQCNQPPGRGCWSQSENCRGAPSRGVRWKQPSCASKRVTLSDIGRRVKAPASISPWQFNRARTPWIVTAKALAIPALYHALFIQHLITYCGIAAEWLAPSRVCWCFCHPAGECRAANQRAAAVRLRPRHRYQSPCAPTLRYRGMEALCLWSNPSHTDKDAAFPSLASPCRRSPLLRRRCQQLCARRRQLSLARRWTCFPLGVKGIASRYIERYKSTECSTARLSLRRPLFPVHGDFVSLGEFHGTGTGVG